MLGKGQRAEFVKFIKFKGVYLIIFYKFVIPKQTEQMITQAYFKDIQHHIKKELEKAKNTIYIAVAWFTDSELFEILCKKVKDGVSVELMLMNDWINNGSRINFGDFA